MNNFPEEMDWTAEPSANSPNDGTPLPTMTRNSTPPAPQDSQQSSYPGPISMIDDLGYRTIRHLPSFPNWETKIPDEATLEDICRYYPNHLFGPRLDPFIKNRWTGGDIWRHMSQEGQNECKILIMRGAEDDKTRANFMGKRLERRIRALSDRELCALMASKDTRKSATNYVGNSKLQGKYRSEEPSAQNQSAFQSINNQHQLGTADQHEPVLLPTYKPGEVQLVATAGPEEHDLAVLLAQLVQMNFFASDPYRNFHAGISDCWDRQQAWCRSIKESLDWDSLPPNEKDEVVQNGLSEVEDFSRKLLVAGGDEHAFQKLVIEKMLHVMLMFAKDQGQDVYSTLGEKVLSSELQLMAMQHLVAKETSRAEALSRIFFSRSKDIARSAEVLGGGPPGDGMQRDLNDHQRANDQLQASVPGTYNPSNPDSEAYGTQLSTSSALYSSEDNTDNTSEQSSERRRKQVRWADQVEDGGSTQEPKPETDWEHWIHPEAWYEANAANAQFRDNEFLRHEELDFGPMNHELPPIPEVSQSVHHAATNMETGASGLPTADRNDFDDFFDYLDRMGPDFRNGET